MWPLLLRFLFNKQVKCMLTDSFKVKVSLLIRYVIAMNAVYWLTISCSFRLICKNLLNNFVMNHDWNIAKKMWLFFCDEALIFMSVSTEKRP